MQKLWDGRQRPLENNARNEERNQHEEKQRSDKQKFLIHLLNCISQLTDL